jgi:translation initiation factor 2B subunit (eIF-2B alpha/beta/delta family)/8-oxo-dGTP pyrophosphatase MutT (NUDIX family)
MVVVYNPTIQRVVTCFVLTRSTNSPPNVTIFHRCATMPTFANFWAAISGTIEPDETPYEAAQRELQEETNLGEHKCIVDENSGGLFINVPYRSPRTDQERIIRVYPFVVYYDPSGGDDNRLLELRGTEHDEHKIVTIKELEAMEMEDLLVPNLVQTFHHATFGRFLSNIPDNVRTWASDKENGASVMTANALKLVHKSDTPTETAKQIAMLRPSMVPIVNVMNEVIKSGRKDAVSMESFQREIQRCVDLGIEEVRRLVESKPDLTIATFSRSGTLAKILQHFIIIQQSSRQASNNVKVICAQSTPGGEGELMAKDLNCDWVTDAQLKEMLGLSEIDLLLVGSDCILDQSMVNKVGTKELCEIAKENNVRVFCCADCWKLWDDTFAPPLERDLFEIVPLELVTKLLVPERLE